MRNVQVQIAYEAVKSGDIWVVGAKSRHQVRKDARRGRAGGDTPAGG